MCYYRRVKMTFIQPHGFFFTCGEEDLLENEVGRRVVFNTFSERRNWSRKGSKISKIQNFRYVKSALAEWRFQFPLLFKDAM